MSDVNFLEKLLDGVAVEWQPLEVVAKIKHGKDWKGLNAGDVPVYGSGGIMGYVDKYLCDKPTVLIPRKGSITNIFYVETPLWNVDTIYYTEIDTLSIVPKYLYHFIKTIDLMSLDTGSGRPSLTQAILNKIQIPIPCPDNPEKSLAIQAEIVRILDTFTELTAELTAELTDRKKQYNYYRDRLLSFEKGKVEWKSFGEVAKVQRGASPRPISKFVTDDENGIPWIKIGDTSPNSKYVENTEQKITPEGATKSRILKKGDFIMSNSMSFGRPYILNIDGAIHDGWASISGFGDRLNADYLYHYLSSDLVQNYWISKINSGSVSNLNSDIIKSLEIPIPSLKIQARIVAILDKFDTLTTSISEGLPREIALRQKQYEYYRDLLLTFPKPEEVEA
jgi:type I restriction enzyme S subunit